MDTLFRSKDRHRHVYTHKHIVRVWEQLRTMLTWGWMWETNARPHHCAFSQYNINMIKITLFWVIITTAALLKRLMLLSYLTGQVLQCLLFSVYYCLFPQDDLLSASCLKEGQISKNNSPSIMSPFAFDQSSCFFISNTNLSVPVPCNHCSSLDSKGTFQQLHQHKSCS